MTENPVEISVVWNDEVHTLCVDIPTWMNIQSGAALQIRGKGYVYEGEHFSDTWIFNTTRPGSLVIEYGDEGGTAFSGAILDANIEIGSEADP